MHRLAVLALLLPACSDDAPAGPDARPMPDAGPCGGDVSFTGGYEDWDSSDQTFLGIGDATVAEDGDASNTATTAPNGRSTLCLPRGAVSEVTYTKADHVTARYTVDPDAVLGAYE